MEKVCIVHDRRSLAKFHENINQLRRSNEFDHSILRRLPKRCCSCGEKEGQPSLTIDHLRQVCNEIQSEQNAVQKQSPSPPVKPTHCLVLDLPPMLTPTQNLYKQGRFIGRRGKNLQPLERTLNVRINILTYKSKKHVRETLSKFQEQDGETPLKGVRLLITLNNEKDNVETITRAIKDAWTKIDVTTKARKPRSARAIGATPLSSGLVSISTDTRWKPAKSRAKDKFRRRSDQDDVLEVAPQPVVRPISMPKEVPKFPKNKRK